MKKVREELRFNKNGITLIALVVTIVVLLILAGITINMLFSENGIITKAREAADKTAEAEDNELAMMQGTAEKIDELISKELEYESNGMSITYKLSSNSTQITLYFELDERDTFAEYKTDIENLLLEAESYEGTIDEWIEEKFSMTKQNFEKEVVELGYTYEEYMEILINAKGDEYKTKLSNLKLEYANNPIVLECPDGTTQNIALNEMEGKYFINEGGKYSFSAVGPEGQTSKIVIKVEESQIVNKATNEYGFYYNTFYISGKNSLYFREDHIYLYNGSIGYWSITSEGKICLKQMIEKEFEILDSNHIGKYERDENYKMTATKAENGIYMNVYYYAKNVENIEPSVSGATKCLADTRYFTSTTAQHKSIYDNGEGSSGAGSEYNLSEYEISNNGKTITITVGNKNIIYELPEELYKFK